MPERTRAGSGGAPDYFSCFSGTALILALQVSKTWQKIVHHPSIWRYHCLKLTATDPTPVRRPPTPEGWCGSILSRKVYSFIERQGTAIPVVTPPRVQFSQCAPSEYSFLERAYEFLHNVAAKR